MRWGNLQQNKELLIVVASGKVQQLLLVSHYLHPPPEENSFLQENEISFAKIKTNRQNGQKTCRLYALFAYTVNQCCWSIMQRQWLLLLHAAVNSFWTERNTPKKKKKPKQTKTKKNLKSRWKQKILNVEQYFRRHRRYLHHIHYSLKWQMLLNRINLNVHRPVEWPCCSYITSMLKSLKTALKQGQVCSKCPKY